MPSCFPLRFQLVLFFTLVFFFFAVVLFFHCFLVLLELLASLVCWRALFCPARSLHGQITLLAVVLIVDWYLCLVVGW